MNASFCEKFTELIMDKWGDLFELDRNKILNSFNGLKKFNINCDKFIFEAMSRLSVWFVPSLLLDDYYLGNVLNSIINSKPYEPDEWEPVKCLEHNFADMMNIDFGSIDTWNIFISAYSEGNELLMKNSERLKLLINDTNDIQFEFVQLILNNAGIIVKYFFDSTPFYMYVMNNLEACPGKLRYFSAWEWRMKHDRENFLKDLEAQDASCGL